MNEDLEKLVESSRKITMTDCEQEEQRRSFAFGNTHIENSAITRDMINRQAESLAD